MKTRKFMLPGLGLAVVLAAAVSLLFSVGAGAGSDNTKIRWDIIHLSTLPPPATTLPGGTASACAASTCDNTAPTITLTGTGTFRPGESEDVTGGGTWTTAGYGAGSGTYTVRGLVSFVLAPGTLNTTPPTAPLFTDGVSGPASGANARAGLAVLRIAYDDGSKGVLVISCDLPRTPPDLPIFEGITASKDFVDYWNRVPMNVAPFGNRTAFHVLPEH